MWWLVVFRIIFAFNRHLAAHTHEEIRGTRIECEIVKLWWVASCRLIKTSWRFFLLYFLIKNLGSACSLPRKWVLYVTCFFFFFQKVVRIHKFLHRIAAAFVSIDTKMARNSVLWLSHVFTYMRPVSRSSRSQCDGRFRCRLETELHRGTHTHTKCSGRNLPEPFNTNETNKRGNRSRMNELCATKNSNERI